MTAIPATKAINLLVINFSRMAFQQQYDHVPSLKSKEEVRTKKIRKRIPPTLAQMVHRRDLTLAATGFLSSWFESLAVAQFTRRGGHPLQPDSFILLSTSEGEYNRAV